MKVGTTTMAATTQGIHARAGPRWRGEDRVCHLSAPGALEAELEIGVRGA